MNGGEGLTAGSSNNGDSVIENCRGLVDIAVVAGGSYVQGNSPCSVISLTTVMV
jgi:hypothetical protein